MKQLPLPFVTSRESIVNRLIKIAVKKGRIYPSINAKERHRKYLIEWLIHYENKFDLIVNYEGRFLAKKKGV